MRRLEREDRHTHRALVLALLHKRALLASGKLRVDTSRQGVPEMASPTRHEKEVLVRVVWQQKPAAQRPWPEHEYRLSAVGHTASLRRPAIGAGSATRRCSHGCCRAS